MPLKPTRHIFATSAVVAALVLAGGIPAHAAQEPAQRATIAPASASNFTVSAVALAPVPARDSFAATSAEEAAGNRATAAAAIIAAASVPSVFAASRIAPSPHGDTIVAVAQSLIGVPYVIGGNSPETGFTCDTFVAFVYAQFGYSLPSGVTSITAMGTQISQSEAVAGDLVVYPGEHIGIYDGAGGIIDAPDVGRSVMQRGIWGSPIFIRIG